MQFRRFGRTELKMPVFSCGGMRYQYKWQDTPLAEIPADNQANLEATIRRSVELGINHIETARGYGSSERQLGLILPQFPREKLIVQTKVGPEADADKFKANFYESLERLQLDHVDLFSVHGINNEECFEWTVRPGGCLEKARELKAEGLVKHIGFSTHAIPELLPRIVGHEDGAGGFDYVNLHWYFIYQRNWPSIHIATKRDMGVFIISPSDKGGMLYQPSTKMRDLTAPMHPIVFNDLFCLMHPEVHTLSIGAARPTDFDLHVEALDKWWDRREALVPAIAERLQQEIERTFGRDYARGWERAVPPYDKAPGETNLQIILWLHLLARAFDMVDYGKMRYNLLGNAGHWFPGRNALAAEDGALRKALSGSPFCERLVQHVREAHDLLFDAPKKRLSES